MEEPEQYRYNAQKVAVVKGNPDATRDIGDPRRTHRAGEASSSKPTITKVPLPAPERTEETLNIIVGKKRNHG